MDMPTLIATLFAQESKYPFGWQCSACSADFTVGRPSPNPSPSQLREVDAEFRQHCKEKHPESKVVGLDIPKEDANQAAARIVREATERD